LAHLNTVAKKKKTNTCPDKTQFSEFEVWLVMAGKIDLEDLMPCCSIQSDISEKHIASPFVPSKSNQSSTRAMSE
jgi:hypothetical protein